jgi:hypothetical protein
MVHCLTKKKSKVYRYYVCQTAIKRGYSKCRTVPPVARRVKQTDSHWAIAKWHSFLNSLDLASGQTFVRHGNCACELAFPNCQ